MNPDSSFMFYGNTALTDIAGLAYFDSFRVTSMASIFGHMTSVTSLEPLAGWNTGNVTDMRSTFAQMTNLVDASAINDWDITRVTATAGRTEYPSICFHYTFNSTPVHPEFTKRAGTWDNLGNYMVSN